MEVGAGEQGYLVGCRTGGRILSLLLSHLREDKWSSDERFTDLWEIRVDFRKPDNAFGSWKTVFR